jgi:hypothetical protein
VAGPVKLVGTVVLTFVVVVAPGIVSIIVVLVGVVLMTRSSSSTV